MIFEITDKSRRKIRLPQERWNHIQREHIRVTDLDELKKTLTTPLKITSSKYDENVCYYYRFNKVIKRYLMVAVKYLNGHGFVITSYYLRNIK